MRAPGNFPDRFQSSVRQFLSVVHSLNQYSRSSNLDGLEQARFLRSSYCPKSWDQPVSLLPAVRPVAAPLPARSKSSDTETCNARASLSILSMEGLRAPRSRSET